MEHQGTIMERRGRLRQRLLLAGAAAAVLSWAMPALAQNGPADEKDDAAKDIVITG